MKGKITIVLLSLVLVFGMIAASCDNGTYPADPYKNDPNKVAKDWSYSAAVPTDEGSWKLSSALEAIGNGTYASADSPSTANDIKPLAYVGSSILKITDKGLTVTTGNNWGGGVDITYGTGAGKIGFGFAAGDTITVTATATDGDVVLRLNNGSYNDDIKLIEKGKTDTKTVTLSAGQIADIYGAGKNDAGGNNGCIRVGVNGASGLKITITEVVISHFEYKAPFNN